MIFTQTTFLELVNCLRELEITASRNEKIKILSSFLKGVNDDEIYPTISLISGSIFPEGDQRVLEIGHKTLRKILSESKQSTLQKSPLTIIALFNQLEKVSSISGKGSRPKRESIISSLVGQASNLETDYIIRMLMGELRIGVGGGLIIEAIAHSSSIDVSLVKRAYTLTGNLGHTAERAFRKHTEGLDQINIRLFEPIKPMLSETALDLQNAFESHKGGTILEYKLDGARVQIHKKNKQVEIFSRRLSKITSSLPEIVNIISTRIKARESILEGEVIAIDHTSRPLPFQDLMRRFRRISDIQKSMEEIPVRLYLFDIIYLDGKSTIDLTQKERRKILQEICPDNLLTPKIVSQNIEEAKIFFNKAIAEGHEGLLAKSLDKKYVPGKRDGRWLKIKQVNTLDLVIVAADWGYGRRQGWLSNYHLAARKDDSDEFLEIGKTFKGLTDEEFKWMTARLLDLKINSNKYTVYVRPEIVVEVAFDEVQKSPHYKSGYALRFARITRIREDKVTKDSNTINNVREIFEAKFKRKGKPHRTQW
ncbi:ATP-dependent DNA ligase [[Eubacterium] cellulosolvens]